MSESALLLKTRLMQLGLKQVDLLDPLREKGFSTMSQPYLNRIINGREVGDTPEAVLSTINQILCERETKN